MQPHNANNDPSESKCFRAITAGVGMLAGGFFALVSVIQIGQDPLPGLFVSGLFFIYAVITEYQMTQDAKAELGN